MGEDDDFVPRCAVAAASPGRFRLALDLAGDLLSVQVPAGFGAPVRRYRPTVVVERGEWPRWQIANRFTSAAGMADWHYELRTLNIALGAVARDVFLGEPPHVVAERALLR